MPVAPAEVPPSSGYNFQFMFYSAPDFYDVTKLAGRLLITCY